jgi:hypothetical protein
MKLYVIEGSFEELSKILPTLDAQLEKTGRSLLNARGSTEPADTERWVTLEEARAILTRRPLSASVRKTLQALSVAGEKKLKSDDLKKVTGFNADQFRGMMGAFGRRIIHTAPENAKFFDSEWDHQSAQFLWRLPENVRQAVRELKLAP